MVYPFSKYDSILSHLMLWTQTLHPIYSAGKKVHLQEKIENKAFISEEWNYEHNEVLEGNRWSWGRFILEWEVN